VVAGYGDVGKGCAQACGHGRPVLVTESTRSAPCRRPWKATEVVTMEDAAPGDIFVTATGNIRRHHRRPHGAMKDQAIVCNIGHFDSEIDIAGPEETSSGRTSSRRSITSSSRTASKIIVLAEGRLVNLGCATGHPSFVMSNSFTNQVLAQIELWNQPRASTKRRSTCCPSTSTRRWRASIWSGRGQADQLTPEQADYIGVWALIEKGSDWVLAAVITTDFWR
jgi:adenosylhomocysteinase